MRKNFPLVLVLLLAVASLFGSGCREADIASYNLSVSADEFQINRRIVFYNGITGDYMLSIEGWCSLGNDSTEAEISVTCKKDGEYKKHFLGLSDNVTYFVEQLEGKDVSKSHYKVIFKPSIIIPDIDIK